MYSGQKLWLYSPNWGDGIVTTVLLRATIDYFTYLLCIYHVTNYAKMDYLGQKYLFLINFSCYTCTWVCILLFKCLYWTSLLNVLFLLAGLSVWRFTVAGKSCTQVWPYEHNVSIYKSTTMYFLVEAWGKETYFSFDIYFRLCIQYVYLPLAASK